MPSVKATFVKDREQGYFTITNTRQSFIPRERRGCDEFMNKICDSEEKCLYIAIIYEEPFVTIARSFLSIQ